MSAFGGAPRDWSQSDIDTSTYVAPEAPLIPTDKGRQFLFIQNVGDLEEGDVVWVNFSATADDSPGSIMLIPGAAVEFPGNTGFVPTGPVTAYAAAAGAVTAKTN